MVKRGLFRNKTESTKSVGIVANRPDRDAVISSQRLREMVREGAKRRNPPGTNSV